MADLKTPGVSIQEIATLPASVPSVASAVPAFVGYTEKAVLPNGTSVLNTPVRLTSMADFQAVFGGAPEDPTAWMHINGAGAYLKASYQFRFFLPASMQLYFANGGGACYLVSVGDFSADPDKDELIDGLATLERESEPTLLAIPDACGLLDAAEVGEVQQAMLSQCQALQNRFAILDVLQVGKTFSDYDTTDFAAFRTNLGAQYLDHGAAYGPFLRLSRGLDYRANEVKFSSFTGELSPIEDKDINDVADTTGVTAVNHTTLDLSNLAANQKTSGTDYLVAYNNAASVDRRMDLIRMMGNILRQMLSQTWSLRVFHASNVTQLAERCKVGGPLEGFMQELYTYFSNYPNSAGTETLTGFTPATDFNESYPHGNWPTGYTGADFDYGVDAITTPLDAGIFTGPDNAAVVANSEAPLRELFLKVYNLYESIEADAELNYQQAEADLLSNNPSFRAFAKDLAARGVNVPPSGAIAGTICAVDRDRGVWKSPANVSLTGLERPSFRLTDEQQGNFNRPNDGSGKGVNIIRSFKGLGHLVWGARTLAGENNEWKYVSVRRLFINVEESIKRATEFVVFEPNEANTWTRVKGMTENYLNGLWRQGALAGATPEEAYFVNVGLHSTMTPQDILEGVLNVEIGMAAVRPAEFIVLKFSHKRQEA